MISELNNQFVLLKLSQAELWVSVPVTYFRSTHQIKQSHSALVRSKHLLVLYIANILVEVVIFSSLPTSPRRTPNISQ